MTNGGRETIGRIEFFGHVCCRNMKNVLQHGRYLFFGCRTIARNALFDFSRRVFHYRELSTQCRSDSHALSASEFEHRLHVFSKERGFNGQFIRMKTVDEFDATFEYFLQFQMVIIDLIQANNAHHHQFHFLAGDFDDAIPEDGGSGVDA